MASAPGARPDRAYVWVWLPGRTEPVVAGVLRTDGDVAVFTYHRSYLDRGDAVPLSLPALPLQPEPQRPPGGLAVAGALRDAAPGAWGQGLIRARHAGRDRDGDDVGLLAYLLESGSDRTGALDFQSSARTYVPRATTTTSLAQLQQAADAFSAGEPPAPAFDALLLRGTPIGGSRPKVLLRDTAPQGSRRGWVAKLSTRTDRYPVVKAEAVAMDLAARVGLDVPATLLEKSLGRDVLLVERFDRVPVSAEGVDGDPEATAAVPGAARRMMVSALTVLELDEATGRRATYPALADQIRARFTDPDQTLRELFARIVFNICVSNTDDHAANHAAFWDGRAMTLTPAYDLCPQPRGGETAEQAMAIDRGGRRASRFAVCLDAADLYHLDRAAAADIVEHQVTVIAEQWEETADAARLTGADRERMWGREILNPTIHDRA
jgi:serine/threonine-protein kinase HipA